MIKKSLWSAAIVTVMLMSGCSQKEPEVDMTQTNGSGKTVTNADAGLDAIHGNTESSDLTSEEMRLAKIRQLEAQAETIYFDFDKYNIRNDQEPRLDHDADLFRSDDAKDLTIKIEGNCDEWGTDEYNYALGLKRAKSVRDALALKGIEESRMVMVSYGESNPVCTEHTKECWAKNRRVDFKLLP